jgi:RNA polymerase sigma-70 factor (ECF subfamily)
VADIDLTDICRRYGASVLCRCRGILRNPDEAQDAAQEVLVTIMTKGHQYRGESAIGTWIYRVTTNHCLNRLRSARRRSVREQHDVVVDWSDIAPADPYHTYAARVRLRQVLDQFDALGQQIVVYRFLDGMTQEEIAAATGKSRRTVGKRLKKIDALLASGKEATIS